ncbi:hypothetical protein DDY07_19395 [Methylomonas sp. ZR1]|nr:hypothetical protein [Methylomonas sp. ZR1]
MAFIRTAFTNVAELLALIASVTMFGMRRIPKSRYFLLRLGYTKRRALRNRLYRPIVQALNGRLVYLNQFLVGLAFFNQMSLECLLYWT